MWNTQKKAAQNHTGLIPTNTGIRMRDLEEVVQAWEMQVDKVAKSRTLMNKQSLYLDSFSESFIAVAHKNQIQVSQTL